MKNTKISHPSSIHPHRPLIPRKEYQAIRIEEETRKNLRCSRPTITRSSTEGRTKEHRVEGDECPVAGGAARISLKARGKSAAARSRISRRDKGRADGDGKYGGFGDKLAAAILITLARREKYCGDGQRNRARSAHVCLTIREKDTFIDCRQLYKRFSRNYFSPRIA